MIEVNNTTKRSIDETFLKAVARAILQAENVHNPTLSIALVGSAASRELNRVYRRKDSAANVLSFPVKRGGTAPTEGTGRDAEGLGEIILCPAEIEKDAKKYGILFTEALAWMLIHGILHVLGYSHRAMIQKEKHYETIYRSRS